MAELLAQLAEEADSGSPSSSQAASQLVSQVAALEEQDSILSDLFPAGVKVVGGQDEEEEKALRKKEEKESLEMTQQVWGGIEEEEESERRKKTGEGLASEAEMEFDLAGMESSWSSSQWQDVEEAIIPQFDGPADEKSGRRLVTLSSLLIK